MINLAIDTKDHGRFADCVDCLKDRAQQRIGTAPQANTQ